MQQLANPHIQYAHILQSLASNYLLIKKQVHLLVTNRDNLIRFYTATITAAFLRKLNHPSKFSDSSLVIRCTRIPSSPISRLKHELAALAEPTRVQKRPRESSVTTKQGPSKRNKKLGDECGGEETT